MSQPELGFALIAGGAVLFALRAAFGLGFVPGLPPVVLDPELVFLLFLPPLL